MSPLMLRYSTVQYVRHVRYVRTVRFRSMFGLSFRGLSFFCFTQWNVPDSVLVDKLAREEELFIYSASYIF